MTCDQAELRMAELLAGELPAGSRAELDRHLLDCAGCRRDYELARTGFRAEWPDQPPSRRTIEATLTSFVEAPAILRFFQVGTAAAAALLVALLLLGSGGHARPAPGGVTVTSPSPRYLAARTESINL